MLEAAPSPNGPTTTQSEVIMLKISAFRVLAAAAVLILPACGGGDGGGNNNPVAPTVPPASAANIAVSISAVSASVGTIPGFGYETSFGLRLVESAGVGANINFIRLEIYNSGGTLLERTEVPGNTFVGGNRLNANQTRDLSVRMGFNSDPSPGRFMLVGVGVTDDRGNNTTFISNRFNF
jgi:hypothetical protein